VFFLWLKSGCNVVAGNRFEFGLKRWVQGKYLSEGPIVDHLNIGCDLWGDHFTRTHNRRAAGINQT